MPSPKSTILLYADIVGYTTLMRANKQDALSKLEQFKVVLQGQTKAHGGKVLQFHQDYGIVAFEQAADAVACTAAAQKELNRDVEVPVRMGIHEGEVVVENGHLFGEGVFNSLLRNLFIEKLK